MAISMLKIRRPLGRLIFNMGIAIPGKTVFLIEMAPWPLWNWSSWTTPWASFTQTLGPKQNDCHFAYDKCILLNKNNCTSIQNSLKFVPNGPIYQVIIGSDDGLTLQWHYNERDGVSNHPPHDCLLNRLFTASLTFMRHKKNHFTNHFIPL